VACNVICISHETGAGGEQVGRLVATQLGFLYVDEEIVARAAAQAGIDPGRVAGEERRRSLVRRVLESIAAGGADLSAVGGAVPWAPDDTSSEIRAFIREAILQTAARGDVVIGAHAASFAIQQGVETLRVLVAATPATRAKRLSEQEGLSDAEAARVIKTADVGRRDYLKRFYEVDRELPTHYDLVLSTDVLSADRAAKIISDAARSEPRVGSV
jgi:cytidylate kinase